METERHEHQPMTSLCCVNCQTTQYVRVEEALARVWGGFLTTQQTALIDGWLRANGWDPRTSWLCPTCLITAMAELV